jgi:hypothetical protein
MTQHLFDFDPKPTEEAKEIQKWVEQHNQQVMIAARTFSIPPGSLLGAVDRAGAKANAVYLLRGILSQYLRNSMRPGSFPSKAGFLHALHGEMAVKKTSQDPAFTLRNILIKARVSR